MIGKALKDLPRAVLRLFCGFSGGWRVGSGEGMCVAGRLFQGYFRTIKLSGRAINTMQLQKTMPSFIQVKRLLESSLWHAALVVALPVLPLSVAHSAACSFSPLCRAFPFSHLAAAAHKTLPVKGSAPAVAQVRRRWGLGAGGRPQEGPSGLCRPSCVTTGGKTRPQAEEPQPGSAVGGTRQRVLLTAVPSGKGCSA